MKQIFLLVFLLATIASFSQSKKEQIKILTNRVDSLSQEVSFQSKTIDDKNSQISGLNTKIANLESSISSLNADISILNLQAQLKTKTDSLSVVLGELEKQKHEITQTRAFKTVKIGTQVWMTENLNVSTFRNGDPIPEAMTEEEWEKAGENGQPAWCYYDNNPENGAKNGKLYNWYAVNDPRGLAPKGYHVPSDEEWTELADFLGGKELAGSKMKSEFGWHPSFEDGTNSCGFSGIPGGRRYFNGTFNFIGYYDCYGYWWSSTEDLTTNAWLRYLYYNNGIVDKVSLNKREGFSVRCLRD